LVIVPPTKWASAVAPSRFPLVLYGLNGLLPITICFRQDMFWAGLLGLIAMAVPLGLAIRAGAPVAVGSRPERGGMGMRDVAVAGD